MAGSPRGARQRLRGGARRGRPPRGDRAGGRAGAAGDVLVIAGKGHEQGQELADGVKRAFDDVDRRREALRCAPGLATAGGGRAHEGVGRRAHCARGRGERGPPPAGAGEPPEPRAARAARAGGVTIDSRAVAPGDLFVGLRGEHARRRRLRRRSAATPGAWGVLVGAEHAAPSRHPQGCGYAGGVASSRPPATRSLGLQALARACWRLRPLGARVVAITGSTGKTSTKDILAALLAPGRAGGRARRTTTPRSGCRSPSSSAHRTEVLVLEMAMRGPRPDRRADGDRASPTSA